MSSTSSCCIACWSPQLRSVHALSQAGSCVEAVQSRTDSEVFLASVTRKKQHQEMKEAAVLGLAILITLSSNAKVSALGGIVEILNPGYCGTAANFTKCPTPPTFDLVDITAFAGNWYEIGASARFKLSQEAGMACSGTNFTVLTSSSQLSANKTSNLSFVDTGVKVVGKVAQFGVQQVAGAAKGLCQNALNICKQLAEGSHIDEALKLVDKAGSMIAVLHPIEFATLQTATASVRSAAGSVSAALVSLSHNVTQIQFLDAQLSQGNGSVKDNMAKLMDVSMRTGRVQDDIQTAVKIMADARGKILQVAAKLVGAGGIDMPIRAVPDLGHAVLLLAAGESAIQDQAAAVRIATFGISAMSGVISVDMGSKRGEYVSTHPGLAIQNASFPGTLEAVWGPSSRAPYLILAVDGLPHLGYDAALVYSCTEVPDRPYEQALFIISRTTSLSQMVIDRFMNVANFHGISAQCDDPFLDTVQDSPLCVAPSPP